MRRFRLLNLSCNLLARIQVLNFLVLVKCSNFGRKELNLDLALWILSRLNQSEFLNLVLNLAKCGPHGALRIFGDVCGP